MSTRFITETQVREKEEELENSRGKNDSLRLEVRKAEKQKRELQVKSIYGMFRVMGTKIDRKLAIPAVLWANIRGSRSRFFFLSRSYRPSSMTPLPTQPKSGNCGIKRTNSLVNWRTNSRR